LTSLNGGDVRLTILAVDAETGEDVVFDTQHARIGPEHICASASFPVLFQPVEIDGRWLVDGGMSANLPLRLALSEPPNRDTLCVALDLVSRKGEHPRSIGAAAERMQDLIFANQSRQTILSLQREYQFRRMATGQEPASGAAVRLLHLAYGGSEGATALKALDFTTDSIRSRWAAGKTDMEAALGQLGTRPHSAPGVLEALALEEGVLRELKAEPH
jgi:NTE family protein